MKHGVHFKRNKSWETNGAVIAKCSFWCLLGRLSNTWVTDTKQICRWGLLTLLWTCLETSSGSVRAGSRVMTELSCTQLGCLCHPNFFLGTRYFIWASKTRQQYLISKLQIFIENLHRIHITQFQVGLITFTPTIQTVNRKYN